MKPSPDNNALDLKALRKKLRHKRRALSPLQQHLAAKRIYKYLSARPEFKRANHIAFYAAIDGELDPALLFSEALRQGKKCYLPSVAEHSRRLRFFRVKNTARLKKGAFGILHATHGKEIKLQQLSLIIMPLVAFDGAGNRLGMGGGYYDYTLQPLAKKAHRKTRLIAIAHRCQEVEALQEKEWDIKPDQIVIA